MSNEKNSVLIVDDEALNITALNHILSSEYILYVNKDGTSALDSVKKLKPDVILLDIVMPGISGFDLIAKIKEDVETRDIPVIFVTGLTESDDEEKGLELGAADYIFKPFRPAIVKLRVRNQIHIVNQMRLIKHLSITDTLTGLSNRRHFNNHLEQEWNRSIREEIPISLLMMDIDNFKQINDTYGHLKGDAILKKVAEHIRACLKRSIDLIARWGGEEFAVLLPNTDLDGTLLIAEKIRSAIEECTDIPTTISIGVNCMKPSVASDISGFMLGADKSLYQAKTTNKNKVCISDNCFQK